jgi:hypothetical protein
MAVTPQIFMKPKITPQHVSILIVIHYQALLSANKVMKK